MASKNDSDNDIVPMGKAIAIIVSVVLGVVVLVGGGVFVAMSLNKTNTSVANSNTQIGNTSIETINQTQNTSVKTANSVTQKHNVNKEIEERARFFIVTMLRGYEKRIFEDDVCSNWKLYYNDNGDLFLKYRNDDSFRWLNVDTDINNFKEQLKTNTTIELLGEMNVILSTIKFDPEQEESYKKSLNTHIENNHTKGIEAMKLAIEDRKMGLLAWEDSKEYPNGSLFISEIHETLRQEFKEMIENTIDSRTKVLKSILKDPSSLQIHETRYRGEVGLGVDIYFDYSAKNSFGGYNRGLAYISKSGELATTTDSNYNPGVFNIEKKWLSAIEY